MKQILDDLQCIDDGVLGVELALIALGIGTSVQIIGKAGKEFLVEVIKRTEIDMLLLAIVLQTLQSGAIGFLCAGYSPCPSAA